MPSWGTCSVGWGNDGIGGEVTHYGCSNPPEIDLGAFPVREVTEVKINGVVIPSAEYQLDGYRKLIRMRTSESAVPTEVWGWPTCQLDDLPDTEQGTFSVTYMHGTPPPEDGVMAAKALARELCLYGLGQANALPTRVTSVTRQNVSMTILDLMDYLEKGRTGIYACDLFIKSINPEASTRPALVWSPDIGRARRLPS
jgi:hypothetical protein